MESGRPWVGYAASAAVAALCTLIAYAITPWFDLVNVAMVYLLGVVLVALRYSRGPAIFGAVAAVASFDFLFVPPRGTFRVDDLQYALTFVIIVAVAIIVSGLVERVRRQAREQAALGVAAETERIRSVLLASISHDLRTPLSVLTGASSSLAESGERMPADERRALAQSVYAQSREISEHVGKLLQMTRLESGRIALDRDWASFTEIAGSVLERLREKLSGHLLLVELSEDLPLVRVEAALVEQALGNLLENAAKHTAPGTAVRLCAEARDRELLVTVQDYGWGLASEDLERVFDKFQRKGTEASGGGMGLGLSICRAIVQLHGGRAWAEAVPAGGVAFKFTLPIEDMPRVQPEPQP